MRRSSCFPICLFAVVVLAATVLLTGGPSGAASPSVGIYAGTAKPSATAVDAQAVELGVQFTVASPGTVTAIRFYESSTDTGAHTASLWSSAGKLLANAVFSAGKSGWRRASFATGVHVVPGQTYTASDHTTVGNYSYQSGAFSNGKTIGVSPQIIGRAGVYAYGVSAFPKTGYKGTAYYVEPRFTADTTTTTPTTTVLTTTAVPTTPASTTTVAPTTTAPTTAPSTSTPPQTGFPNGSNTGIPVGTSLTTYTGQMIVTAAGTTITGKTISGDLRIQAANVTVSNSQVNGDVRIDSDDVGKGYSFTIKDSNVNAQDALGHGAFDGTGIGAVDFTALRVNVVGGKLSVNCYDTCTVQDSWLHAQATDKTGVAHEGGVRVGQSANIIHNTISCEGQNVAPQAGCSGDFTGYGDGGPVQNVLAQNNYFVSETTGGGICAYGGSSAGKPYSADANHIRFINNTFGKATTNDHGVKDCAYYAAVADFDSSAPGNQFTGNVYTDGTPVSP